MVSPQDASILEPLKDLPLATASFLLASFVPKWGYKNTMLSSLCILIASSIIMALTGDFVGSKIFFVLSGVAFGLFKVAGYPTIGLLTKTTSEHAGFLSIMEAMFMIGVLCGFWLFGYFIELESSGMPIRWYDLYWGMALLNGTGFIFLYCTDLNETQKEDRTRLIGNHEKQSSLYIHFSNLIIEWKQTILMLKLPLVLFFCMGIFLYVYAEQALGSWLPSFNHKVLSIPKSTSVQLVMFYGGTLALGRFIGGILIKRFHWFYVLQISLLCLLVIFIFGLLLTNEVNSSIQYCCSDIPLSAWIIPLSGLFFAPLYPTLTSTILTSLSSSQQSRMTSILVVFSALGGSTGSLITGAFFEWYGGISAMYYLTVPVLILFMLLFPYKQILKRDIHSTAILSSSKSEG